MVEKHNLFIGSSSEAYPIAKIIETHLHEIIAADAQKLYLEIVLWKKRYDEADVLNETFMQTFSLILEDCDFGLFILNKDDQLYKRIEDKKELKFTARDNVWLEAGMFIGKIGLNRTFFFLNMDDFKSIHFPTDINGYTLGGVHWDSNLVDLFFSNSTGSDLLFRSCPDAYRLIEDKINSEVNTFCFKLVEKIKKELGKNLIKEEAIIIKDRQKCFEIGISLVENAKETLYTSISFGKSLENPVLKQEEEMQKKLEKVIKSKSNVSFQRYMNTNVLGIKQQYESLKNLIKSLGFDPDEFLYERKFDYLELIISDSDVLIVFPDYRGHDKRKHEKVAFGLWIKGSQALADVVGSWLIKKIE